MRIYKQVASSLLSLLTHRDAYLVYGCFRIQIVGKINEIEHLIG